MQRALFDAGSRTANVAADSRVNGTLATATGRFLERIYDIFTI